MLKGLGNSIIMNPYARKLVYYMYQTHKILAHLMVKLRKALYRQLVSTPLFCNLISDWSSGGWMPLVEDDCGADI